jgi:hypothetical protein
MPIPMCVRSHGSRSIALPLPMPAGIHDVEGPDDMPAHIKTMLTDVSLHVPVIGGALALGTWQGIYVAEHRARPHTGAKSCCSSSVASGDPQSCRVQRIVLRQ